MDKFFKISESGSTVKTEIIAGVCTFCAMAYILFVNAGMFAELGEGVTYEGMYIATALGAIVGSVLMGLIARLPLAQASGMGLNAFAVYTICFTFGFSYANALAMVLIDGIVFVILTATGLRSKLVKAIPTSVRVAIGAGIGLFIAYIGLQNAGIVVPDASTASAMASMNFLTGSATWASIMPIVVTCLTVCIIAVLQSKKVKGSVLWGLGIGAAMYYLLGFSVPGFYEALPNTVNLNMNVGDAFNTWATDQFGTVFTSGFDFSAYIAANGSANFAMVLITSILAFCLVDMFDTIGTLYGACARGNLLTEEGEVPNVEKAMFADSIATCTGAIFGTSTVTTFVESSAGTAEGGKTGLTALVVAALFAVAMIFAPVAQVIPGAVTAAILIYVGALMMVSIKTVDWTNMEVALPSFLTVAIMPLTYNISYGIAAGVMSYMVIKIMGGKIKKIRPGTWVIGILFLAMIFLSH